MDTDIQWPNSTSIPEHIGGASSQDRGTLGPPSRALGTPVQVEGGGRDALPVGFQVPILLNRMRGKA